MRSLFESKRRNDFWETVAAQNISLIHDGECDASSVAQQESEEVWMRMSDLFVQQAYANMPSWGGG
jgi:hypothetical protein